jgi:hypothetical protein
MGIDPFLVAAEMARELKNKNPNISLIQFLPNIFEWFPIDKAVEGIKSVFGPGIPIFGAVSMDNFKAINSYHFFDDQVVERGAVMIGYGDPTLKFISQANHGFNIVEGKSFEVTRSESNCIQELNGKPVWKELTETLGLPETAQPLEVVAIACFAKELPEELQEEYGSKYLLFAIGGKNKDNSIITNITCPIGMKIWLTKRNEEKMFNGADLMMKKILDTLQENKPLAVFHADCVLRGRFSLNRILKDELINHLQFPICGGENVPWLGLYSGGEFAMIGGQTWYHNITSSLFVIYR